MLPMHMMPMPGAAAYATHMHLPHPFASAPPHAASTPSTTATTSPAVVANDAKPTYISTASAAGYADMFGPSAYLPAPTPLSARQSEASTSFHRLHNELLAPISSLSPSSGPHSTNAIMSPRSAFKPTAFAQQKRQFQQQQPPQIAVTFQPLAKEDDEVTSSDADLLKLPTAIEAFPTTSAFLPIRLDRADADDATATSDGEDAVFESAAKLLFLAVKWAKSMASFAQLPLADQTRLLEESWAELFIVTAVQYGLAAESKCIFLNIKAF